MRDNPSVAQISDQERLTRFVRRARRIQAHSLVQDWDALVRLTRGGWEISVEISGSTSVTRRLPGNEEIFESLASRIRPLTVKKEPVYYVEVFAAIERLLGVNSRPQRLEQLKKAWERAEIQGTQTQSYTLQTARLDSSDATNPVSDTQLAAAWLYADLVHADATGPKKEALAFPLRERYAAAVRVFSQLAALTVETLQLIEALRDDGALTIPNSAWDEDVVIGASEFVQRGTVHVAAVGTPTPDLRTSPELGTEWSRPTVTDLLRRDPANQVRVDLQDAERSTIAAYDAAAVWRASEEISFAWDVLVAGSVIFKFSFDVQDERVTNARFVGWEVADSSHELRLASTRLLLQIHHSSSMNFIVGETTFLTLEPPTFSANEVQAIEIDAEVTADIVAIERLTGQEIAPGDGSYDDRDRVRLRCARLMWEDHVVNAMRRSIIVTKESDGPPQAIGIPAATLDIGGAQVPTSGTIMWHPGMVVTEAGAAPEASLEAKRYAIRPPDGEHFLAWSPDRVEAPTDQTLAVTASWGLTGIDEKAFQF